MTCPHCQRVLYSRQHPRCGHCGADLPDHLRLTTLEVATMKAEMREIEQRRQVAKEQEEEEREATRRRNRHRGRHWQGGGFPGGLP